MEEQNTVFTIGDKEYDVIQVGIGQARQVAALSQWLGKYGKEVTDALLNSDNGFSSDDVLGMIMTLLGSLDDNGILTLFEIVFGCTRKVSEKHFDISLLVDGASSLFQHQPAIKRLSERFFSGPSSQSQEEETSTQ